MNNHYLTINQALEDSFLDLPYNSTQHEYKTDETTFHVSPKVHNFLTTSEAQTLFQKISQCQKILAFHECEEIAVMQVWTLKSYTHTNTIQLVCGSILEPIQGFKIENFSLSIPRIVLFISPMLHKTKTGFLVFCVRESPNITNVIARLIEKLDEQEKSYQ